MFPKSRFGPGSPVLFLMSLLVFHNRPFAQAVDADAFIKEIMDQSRIPGLSACLVKNGGVVWSNAYGWADIDNRIPMTLDTVQNIASVSKTVTATAVMQLWEKGLFKLDDDVSGYLPFKVRNPRFPDAAVTFRQLLTHRSSIKDGPAYEESYALGDPRISLETWLREYLVAGGRYYDREGNFHAWKPGETGEIPEEPRAYSNVGFGLLGYLVESISSQPFGEYTKKNIFDPLGMSETSWYIKDIDTKKQAVPYYHVSARDAGDPELRAVNAKLGLHGDKPVEEGFLPLGLYSFPNISDGLVRTSVRQFGRFLAMYLNDGDYQGKRILRKTTVDTMLSAGHFGRGLCWDTSELGDGDTYWVHGGGDPGIRTMIAFNRENRTGLVLFTNISSGEAGKGVREIISRLLVEAKRLQ